MTDTPVVELDTWLSAKRTGTKGGSRGEWRHLDAALRCLARHLDQHHGDDQHPGDDERRVRSVMTQIRTIKWLGDGMTEEEARRYYDECGEQA